MRSAAGLVTAAVSAAIVFVALGFVAMMIYTTVGPAREALQDFAVCRGADRIERDVSHTSVRRTTAGGYQETGATTTDLACYYGDEVRLVGNDSAFLRGGAYGVAGVAIVSVLAGAVFGALAAAKVRRRTPAPPAPPGPATP